MLDAVSDDAFARYVRQTGMATAEQIEAARAKAPLPLADALVLLGVVTALQRETVEKKLEAQREHAGELGGYKLLKKLGEGGMGAVYLAELAELAELAADPAGPRKVAIKVLPKKHSQDREFVKRFQREAEAAMSLEHPNVVRGYASGEDKGYPFFVMEYCEGESLRQRLERVKVVPVDDATGLVVQIAQGLKAAHDRGFIHRDIKPENIIVTPAGVAKILDLGLAKNIEDRNATFRTVTGVAMGTPHYLSPEQARGDKGIDGRSDIYSLGATYYHLVTGRTPFQGASIYEVIQRHLMEQLPDPRDLRPEIPASAVQILRRMLAKLPSDRYADCASLLLDLERLLARKAPLVPSLDASLSSMALPETAPTASRPRPAKRYAWIYVAAGATLIAGAIASFPPSETPAEPIVAAAPPPKPAPTAMGADLLSGIPQGILERGRGSWRLADGALISPADGLHTAPALIHLPATLPEEYDLDIEAQRVSGTEDLVFALSSGRNEFGMVLDGWQGESAGLNGPGGGFNWQRRGPGRVFADGKPHGIRFEVRRTGVALKIDRATPILTLTDYSQSSIPSPAMTQGRVAGVVTIATVRSSFKITRVVLTPAPRR